MAAVGFIGLGKLGPPVALAIESRGHDVVGFDINPSGQGYLHTAVPTRRAGDTS